MNKSVLTLEEVAQYTDRCGKKIAADLKCTPKTILNHLKKLHALDWIGYNPKSKYYFIRGFESVMNNHDLTARAGG